MYAFVLQGEVRVIGRVGQGGAGGAGQASKM